MSEQVIQIKMKDGKPLVSNEMKAAVMGEFYIETGFVDSDKGEFQYQKQAVPWDMCKQIYQAMVMASVGNIGEIKTIERCIAAVDPPKQRIIPCLSVLFKNGNWIDRMVIENQSAPQTLAEWSLLQDKFTQAFRDSNPMNGRAKPVIISYIELFEEVKQS